MTLDELYRNEIWQPGMVDSHFHARAMKARGVDPAPLLASLEAHGMGTLVDVAIQPEEAMEELRNPTFAYRHLYRTCGLHPSVSSREDWRTALEITDRAIGSGAFAAVGEMGLDWYRMPAPRERQCQVFEAQLSVARQHGYPVIVHNRDADRECRDLLRTAHLPRGGIMHCFSSGPEWVGPFLDLGMYISFAGNVTFRSAHALRDAVRQVPKERLLLETDAPFLAPHPHRGRTNHPAMVAWVYRTVAEARNTPVEELIPQVAKNTELLLSTSRGAEL